MNGILESSIVVVNFVRWAKSLQTHECGPWAIVNMCIVEDPAAHSLRGLEQIPTQSYDKVQQP